VHKDDQVSASPRHSHIEERLRLAVAHLFDVAENYNPTLEALEGVDSGVSDDWDL
jgi:hypothetical protein